MSHVAEAKKIAELKNKIKELQKARIITAAPTGNILLRAKPTCAPPLALCLPLLAMKPSRIHNFLSILMSILMSALTKARQRFQGMSAHLPIHALSGSLEHV